MSKPVEVTSSLNVSASKSYELGMHVDTWRGLSRVFGVFAFVACGCSDQSSPAPNFDGSVKATNERPADAEPCVVIGTEGCSCTETGAIVECGRITNVSGDYVTCVMGYATCDGTKWGACLGDRVVEKANFSRNRSPDNRRSLGFVSSCNNPCDPTCRQVTGESSDVDVTGVTVTDAGVSITETTASGGPGSGPCYGLWCNVATCNGLPKTSLSGKVYDPAGKVPLYNAYVYIPVDPTAALPTLPEGASCDTCVGGAAVSAIALAQTGPDGSFHLENVPSGTGVPLIVQLGKWRRKVTLPAIAPCVDNPVDSTNSRLPRNRFDGDGNTASIPRMAIASGSADPFECLLLKAGIDANEIQLPGAGARIDFYRYNGKDRVPGGAPSGSTLTSSVNTLKQYDVVLLPCEGRENEHNLQVPNLVTYTSAGGRVFTTHYGYVWLATPSPVGVASNLSEFYGTAAWDIGRWDFNDPMDAYVEQTFPKGIAFAQWLQAIGASTMLGSVRINEPRHNALNAVSGKSQRWMYGGSRVAALGTYDMLLAMTFNTPVNAAAEQQCGRVVFSDFHVSADALVSTTGCSNDSDCGFGAFCNPAVAGRCVESTCRTNTDCGSGFVCSGAHSGACSTQSCTSKHSCGGRVCSSGTCAPGACFESSDCGAKGWCTDGELGTCARTCTSGTDCPSGYSCVSGQCSKRCLLHQECASRFCENATASSCSTASNMFPTVCRNGDLTDQEKVLEFMLFDLSACVSPDSWAPPVPTTQYDSVTFNLDFTADCAANTRPIWREFKWQAIVPNTSNITFDVATAATTAQLGEAVTVPLAVTQSDTVLPSWDTAFIDVEGGAFRDGDPQRTSLEQLRIAVTLNPTAERKASPRLSSWQVTYDCEDAL